MPAGKKKRAHKESRGERRSSKPIKLDAIQLVLLGKGICHNISGSQKKVAGGEKGKGKSKSKSKK